MSMKNCSDNIGNQTRDIPTCSAVLRDNVPVSDSEVAMSNKKAAEQANA
jgi:hypothetical protein